MNFSIKGGYLVCFMLLYGFYAYFYLDFAEKSHKIIDMAK